MKPIGVGIIGAGTGRRHAPGFAADSRVSHVALCDNDDGRLRERAAELDIDDTTTHWRDFIDRDDIGLVDVSSPDHLHCEMAVAALDAGKHVLCEKPMAMNMDECGQMIAAVERSGCKLLVNNVLRFWERFQYVKKIVDEGVLGDIYAAEGDYLHNTLHLIRDGWRGTHRHSCATGGGVHLIDLLRWIVGELDEAMCYGTYGVLSPDKAKSPDCMVAILKFKNGAVAKSMTNMALQKPALHNLILYGTKGVFINDKPDGHLYLGEKAERQAVTAVYGPGSDAANMKSVAVSHLLDSIEHDTAPLVDVYEGARSIAVCDAMYESYRTGQPAKVPDLPSHEGRTT